MAERKARIAGARREAESLHAAAQAKQRAHQDALRKARTEIFAEQEASRRVLLDERNATIQAARSSANEKIQNAKRDIAQEIEAARAELGAESDRLAEEIARSILDPRSYQPNPAGPA